MMAGKSKMKKRKINREDIGIILMCAIRYCHGRPTSMSSRVRDICRAHLKKVSVEHLQFMLNDCDFQGDTDIYGAPLIDASEWKSFYRNLKAEMKRRYSK